MRDQRDQRVSPSSSRGPITFSVPLACEIPRGGIHVGARRVIARLTSPGSSFAEFATEAGGYEIQLRDAVMFHALGRRISSVDATRSFGCNAAGNDYAI